MIIRTSIHAHCRMSALLQPHRLERLLAPLSEWRVDIAGKHMNLEVFTRRIAWALLAAGMMITSLIHASLLLLAVRTQHELRAPLPTHCRLSMTIVRMPNPLVFLTSYTPNGLSGDGLVTSSYRSEVWSRMELDADSALSAGRGS